MTMGGGIKIKGYTVRTSFLIFLTEFPTKQCFNLHLKVILLLDSIFIPIIINGKGLLS